MYCSISQILLLCKTWRYCNKFDSSKSLVVCYWCVKIPRCGYIEYGLKHISFYVQKEIVAMAMCYNPALVDDKPPKTKVFIAIHTYMITGATIILTPNMSQIETQNINMEKNHMYGKGSMKPKQTYELHIWYTLKHSSICESVQLCQVQLCKKEHKTKTKTKWKEKHNRHNLKMIFIVRHIKSM